MIPVRGSTWSPSEPPACALPRKPCSGPKTAVMSTFPDACMVSTMCWKSGRMPVGLLITPTFWPARARQPSAASTSAPVSTLRCAGDACAAWRSTSGAAASTPAPASRLRRFMKGSSGVEREVGEHRAVVAGGLFDGHLGRHLGAANPEAGADRDEVDPLDRVDRGVGVRAAGGPTGRGPGIGEPGPQAAELRRVRLGVDVADQDLQVLAPVGGQDLQGVGDLRRADRRIGAVV